MALQQKVTGIFELARRKRAFPGGTVWLDKENIHLEAAFGRTTYDDAGDFLAGRETYTDMLYDAASLTKLITATAVLMTLDRLQISLDQPIAAFFADFRSGDYRNITIRHLLLHNSGLGIPLQALAEAPHAEWIERIAIAPLHAAPGTTVRYSCTNFFLLARLLELWNDTPADEWIKSHLLDPLEMMRSTYWPQKYFSLDEIAPTEIDAQTGRPWHGVVHDEAARSWQRQTHSTSGNSGLFTTASDLAKFVELWKNAGTLHERTYFPESIAAEALRPQAEEVGVGWRGLGWQIDALSYMGHKAPRGSAGHAGFTGPTLFFTPAGACVIIMENRVYPTREGPYRLMYHRRIAQALLES